MNNDYLGKIDFNNKAKRVPICFCVDVSLSMDEIIEGEEFCKITGSNVYGDGRQYGYMEPIKPNDPRVKTKMDKLSEGLGAFYQAIKEDDMACDSCVSEIVTFKDTPSLFEQFDNVDDKRVPKFPRPSGNTNMTKALEMALDTLDKQKALYKQNCMPYFQPWLVVFTDGQPSDDITRITNELIKRQKNKRLIVYICPLAKEDDKAAMDKLKKLVYARADGGQSEFIPCDDPKRIREFFAFLARSVSVVANDETMPSFFDDISDW